METVKDKVKKEKYRNWVKSTLGLEQTGRALYEYVEEKFSNYTHWNTNVGGLSFLDQDELFHIRHGGCLRLDLTDKIELPRGKGKSKWQWTDTCKKCKTSFDKILSLHDNPYRKDICWENSNYSGNITLEWAIAKMFMPRGNGITNTGPEATDPQAIFQLILACNLFKIDSVEHLEKLTKARNKLFHSSDNLVDETDMKTYFKHMKKLLKNVTDEKEVATGIRDRITESIKKIKKLKNSEMTMALFDDALKVKRKGIFDDFEKSLSENDPDALKELLELATNTVAEIQLLKRYADEVKHIENYKKEIESLKREIRNIEACALMIMIIITIAVASLMRLGAYFS